MSILSMTDLKLSGCFDKLQGEPDLHTNLVGPLAPGSGDIVLAEQEQRLRNGSYTEVKVVPATVQVVHSGYDR